MPNYKKELLECLEVHSENANQMKSLSDLQADLTVRKENKFYHQDPVVLEKAESVIRKIESIQADLLEIGKRLDQSLDMCIQNAHTAPKKLNISLDKRFVVYENDSKILVRLPFLVLPGKQKMKPSFWFSKKLVTESLADGCIDIRIYSDWDIAAYQYNEQRKISFKIDVSAEAFASIVNKANERIRKTRALPSENKKKEFQEDKKQKM